MKGLPLFKSLAFQNHHILLIETNLQLFIVVNPFKQKVVWILGFYPVWQLKKDLR